MTELAEKVAAPLFKAGLGPCPFKDEGPLTSALDEESVGDDDVDQRDDEEADTMDEPQGNNGGVLGENLEKASPACWGTDGTWNNVYPPPQVKRGIRRRDSHPERSTTPGVRVKVFRETSDGKKLRERVPFIVAAHHLIPGNASLFPSKLYVKYMVEAGTQVKAGGKTMTGGKVMTKSGEKLLLTHIGYNVNGSHNGVWLPGNYAIRKKNPHNPWKKTWSNVYDSDPDWCYRYMTACVAKAHGQFHDTHDGYNKAAKGVLNKVFKKLKVHQDTCEDCEDMKEIYPPYALKERLYWFSGHLRGKVRKVPRKKWELPWCTSDRFKAQLLKAKVVKPQPPGGPR
jgi:hypothetical protein